MDLCITDIAVEEVSLETRNQMDSPLSVDSRPKNKMNFLLTFRNSDR
jgi:hypothetical protein